MPIIFVDFYDSFSHNILAYLKAWGQQIKVIHPNEVNTYLSHGHKRFVWGPGPGRVEDYAIDLNLVRTSIQNLEHRHFGICLGHQLLGLALGGKYGQEVMPRHGIADEITLPRWS